MEQIEVRAGIKFEIMDPPSEKEVVVSASPSVLRAVKDVGNINEREYDQEARELLEEYGGDTQKVIRRLVASLKEHMSCSNGQRPYNAPSGKENRRDAHNMNNYRHITATNTDRPRPMGRGSSDGNGYRGEVHRNAGSGRGASRLPSRALPDGFSSGPGSTYTSTPQSYAGYSDSIRSTPVCNQYEDAPVAGSMRSMKESMNGSSRPIDQDFCKIFMGNLHFEMTDKDLSSLFATNGLRVANINLLKDPQGKSKGIGFATFETPRDAAYAVKSLNGFQFKGRPVRFEIADPNHQKAQGLRERPEKKKLFNGPSVSIDNDGPVSMPRGRGRGIMAR